MHQGQFRNFKEKRHGSVLQCGAQQPKWALLITHRVSRAA
jgi:hypothetical protein